MILYRLILFFNKFFKKRDHPFNRGGKYKLNYADFEYESAKKVFKDFEKVIGKEIGEIVRDKEVLDLGCGAGGKTVFIKENGAQRVVGVDLSELLIKQADCFQKERKMDIEFHQGNVCELPFKDNVFDLLIASDLVEHVKPPEKMFKEAYRVLKSGGVFLINFEPYYHFLGHHMWDMINIPWVHVFFSEQTRIKAYKTLVKDIPDGAERLKFRLDVDVEGREYLGYLNGMTVHRFLSILDKSGFIVLKKQFIPLSKFPFTLLNRLPFFREFSNLRLIYVLTKK